MIKHILPFVLVLIIILVSVSFLSLIPFSNSAGPSIIQTACNSHSSPSISSLSVSFSSTVTKNDKIIVAITSNTGGSEVFATITDSSSNTYGSHQFDDYNSGIGINSYFVVGTAGSTTSGLTITASFSPSLSNINVCAFEVSQANVITGNGPNWLSATSNPLVYNSPSISFTNNPAIIIVNFNAGQFGSGCGSEGLFSSPYVSAGSGQLGAIFIGTNTYLDEFIGYAPSVSTSPSSFTYSNAINNPCGEYGPSPTLSYMVITGVISTTYTQTITGWVFPNFVAGDASYSWFLGLIALLGPIAFLDTFLLVGKKTGKIDSGNMLFLTLAGLFIGSIIGVGLSILPLPSPFIAGVLLVLYLWKGRGI